MGKNLAFGISVAFQPLAIPSFIILTILYGVPESTTVPHEAKWSLLLLISLTTFIIPIIGLVGMKMTSSIESLQMYDKKERIVPFAFISLFYCMNATFFYIKLNVDELLVMTVGMVTLCLVLLTLVTVFWKISAHLMALGGWLAVISVLSIRFQSEHLLYYLLATLIICGAVGTARLYLNTHKPSEIYGGFALGFFLCFGVYYYLLF
ncbi:MAG: PA-phosphatase [Cyclobacteriaceae bacterium]